MPFAKTHFVIIYHRKRKRNAYKVLMGKYETRRPLGRFRQMWGDIIEKELVEIGWADVGWIYLAQDMGMWQVFVNMVMNKWVP